MEHLVTQENTGLNIFYTKIYSLVGLGVAISAVVSALMLLVFPSIIISIYSSSSFVYYGIIFAELALVWVASAQASKNSPLALPLFLIYSAMNGFTLSVVLAAYTQTAVYTAFGISAAMFFTLSVIGRVTKKDLSGMGRAFLAGLIGLIIASLVNLFLQSSMLDYILSFISVVIFSGLIAWDNQKIRYVYEATDGQVNNGWAVSLALSLYLDFINLFLSILRILGRND